MLKRFDIVLQYAYTLTLTIATQKSVLSNHNNIDWWGRGGFTVKNQNSQYILLMIVRKSKKNIFLIYTGYVFFSRYMNNRYVKMMPRVNLHDYPVPTGYVT